MLALEDGEYEVCIDSTLARWAFDLRRVLSPGQSNGRSSRLVPLPAIHRWPMTISPESPWPPPLAQLLSRTGPPLLVSFSFYSWNNRSHHVAGAKPRSRRTHPPRAGAYVHRRRGRFSLTRRAAGETRRLTGLLRTSFVIMVTRSRSWNSRLTVMTSDSIARLASIFP